jgi:hypothetical protein
MEFIHEYESPTASDGTLVLIQCFCGGPPKQRQTVSLCRKAAPETERGESSLKRYK